MPFKLIRRRDGGVVFKGSGVVGRTDGLNWNALIYSSDGAVRAISYQLIDLTEATDFTMSSSDMQKLARGDDEALSINSEMRIAIVAPDSLSFGLNRMYQAFLLEPRRKVGVFRDMESAESWLKDSNAPPIA